MQRGEGLRVRAEQCIRSIDSLSVSTAHSGQALLSLCKQGLSMQASRHSMQASTAFSVQALHTLCKQAHSMQASTAFSVQALHTVCKQALHTVCKHCHCANSNTTRGCHTAVGQGKMKGGVGRRKGQRATKDARNRNVRETQRLEMRTEGVELAAGGSDQNEVCSREVRNHVRLPETVPTVT